MRLSRGETEFAKRVWADVDSAAQQVPEWVKDQILRASQEAVREIEKRLASLTTKSSK